MGCCLSSKTSDETESTKSPKKRSASTSERTSIDDPTQLTSPHSPPSAWWKKRIPGDRAAGEQDEQQQQQTPLTLQRDSLNPLAEHEDDPGNESIEVGVESSQQMALPRVLGDRDGAAKSPEAAISISMSAPQVSLSCLTLKGNDDCAQVTMETEERCVCVSSNSQDLLDIITSAPHVPAAANSRPTTVQVPSTRDAMKDSFESETNPDEDDYPLDLSAVRKRKAASSSKTATPSLPPSVHTSMCSSPVPGSVASSGSFFIGPLVNSIGVREPSPTKEFMKVLELDDNRAELWAQLGADVLAAQAQESFDDKLSVASSANGLQPLQLPTATFAPQSASAEQDEDVSKESMQRMTLMI